MAVLGRQAILQAVDDGLIAITPFNADHVGPASVDLTLGSTFRVFRKVHEVIAVRDHTDCGVALLEAVAVEELLKDLALEELDDLELTATLQLKTLELRQRAILVEHRVTLLQ